MSQLNTQVIISSTLQSKYTRTDQPGQLLDMGSTSGNGALSQANIKQLNKNPNWRTTIARHGDASSAYSRTEQTYLQHFRTARSFGYPVAGSKSITAEGWNTALLYFDPSIYWQQGGDADLQDLALARLKRKVNDQSAQVNALVPIVELRDLRGTIASLMNATSAVLQSVILAKKTHGKSAAKTVANLWLTWSFGIKPMVSDIQAISNAINDLVNGHEKNVVLHGSAKKDWLSEKKLTAPGPFMTSWSGAAQFAHVLSYRYTAGLGINLRSSNNYGVQTQLGLNLQGIPSVLWELTAFSWVVDYFSTVGAYLDDTFSTDANTCRYVVLNKRYTMDMYLDGETKQIVSYAWPTAQQNRIGLYKANIFTRSVLGSIPNRALRFKSVDEIAKNAGNKLANLISVAAGMMPGFNGHRPFK